MANQNINNYSSVPGRLEDNRFDMSMPAHKTGLTFTLNIFFVLTTTLVINDTFFFKEFGIWNYTLAYWDQVRILNIVIKSLKINTACEN